MALDKDLLTALLSLDVYNRGYNPGIEGLGSVGSSLGQAYFLNQSNTETTSDEFNADFYAAAYTVTYESGATETIIAYRGTDTPYLFDPSSDVWTGWVVGGGFANSAQARLAAA